MERLCDIGRTHNIKIIENASHSLGAKLNGRKVGSFGVTGCFAMSPDSSFGAFGDAGMVVTNEQAIADRIRLLRDHGRNIGNGSYEHVQVGFSSRMDAIQAAVLRVKMPHIGKWLCRRQQIATMYRDLLADQDLGLPPEQPNVEPSLHRFVIRTPHRGQLRRRLKSEGVDTGIHFPIPTHLQPAYRHLGYQVGDFPVAEGIAQEVLSLPMYPELTDEEVCEVVKCFGISATAQFESSTIPERASNNSCRKLMEVKGNSNVSF